MFALSKGVEEIMKKPRTTVILGKTNSGDGRLSGRIGMPDWAMKKAKIAFNDRFEVEAYPPKGNYPAMVIFYRRERVKA